MQLIPNQRHLVNLAALQKTLRKRVRTGDLSEYNYAKIVKLKPGIALALDQLVSDSASDVLVQRMVDTLMDHPDLLYFCLSKRFHINDFFALSEIDFIPSLYVAILRRRAAFSEVNYWKQFDLISRSSRIDIIHRILHSEEGSKNHVKVKGLKSLRTLNSVFSLPLISATKHYIRKLYN